MNLKFLKIVCIFLLFGIMSNAVKAKNEYSFFSMDERMLFTEDTTIEHTTAEYAESINEEGLSVPALYLKGKPCIGNFRLRWAVSSPELWEIAKRRGFILERFSFTPKSKGNNPVEKKSYKIEAVLNQDSSIWQSLILRNDYAALLAQSIYGQDFNLNVMGQSQWESVAKGIEENQLRFSMAMLACDRSFEAACAGKMGYEDTNLAYGEKYLYRIYIDTNAAISDTALFFTDMSYLESPIPMQSLRADFDDKTVKLQWNTEIFQNQFVAYDVERSFDKKNFVKRNRVPIVQTSKDSYFTHEIVYQDSLDENEKIYYYRILGIDIFGDAIPITHLEQGAGKGKNMQSATIETVVMQGTTSALLYWHFPSSENEKISCFRLRNKSAMYGEYILIDSMIQSKNRRKQVDRKYLFPSNYFRLEVFGKEGELRASSDFFFQIPDSTPPLVPMNLTYNIDSNGRVFIKWDSVKDAGICAYRIFRANKIDAEYVQMSSDLLSVNNFWDSLSLSTAKAVFYKVVAVDGSGNTSDFSKALEVKRPVRNTPSAPVFANCFYENDTVFLSWYNSPEEEVTVYLVYQRRNGESWECIYKGGKLFNPKKYIFSEMDSISLFINGEDAEYTFKIVSLTDTYDTAVCPFLYSFKYKRKLDKPNLFVSAQRDKKGIFIEWTYAQAKRVQNYYLYRKEGDGTLRLLQIMNAESSSYFDTKLKINTHYAYCLRVEGKNGKWSTYSDLHPINY